ncbi:MAG: FHA domain-containing protein [Nannocystaceae bacterium]
MSESIPCPACGSPSQPGDDSCSVCGFFLVFEAGAAKCSRCGSSLGDDFQFCQVCGLARGLRLPRPSTQRLKVVTTEVRRRRAPARPTAERTALEPEPQRMVTPAPRLLEASPNAVTASDPGHPFAGWSTSPLRLVLVNRDGTDGQSFFFPDTQLTLGRSQGDLRFERDEFVSPLHARLEVRADGLWIVDLGARNGVFVRISGSVPVFPGDAFLIGHQLLRLDNVPAPEGEHDDQGVRIFGTPLDPSWARLTLVGVGGVEAESFYLRAPTVIFGRQTGDILFPTDAFISRQHAQLVMEIQGASMIVALVDLGSANGTYLRIRGEARLGVGDMFRIGDQILRVRKD